MVLLLLADAGGLSAGSQSDRASAARPSRTATLKVWFWVFISARGKWRRQRDGSFCNPPFLDGAPRRLFEIGEEEHLGRTFAAGRPRRRARACGVRLPGSASAAQRSRMCLAAVPWIWIQDDKVLFGAEAMRVSDPAKEGSCNGGQCGSQIPETFSLELR